MKPQNKFWNRSTYQIIQAMKATGNQPGVVEQWKQSVARWALTAGREGEAVRQWLPLWQVRPFYTADELAPMWPALGLALGITERMEHVKSGRRLGAELDYGGLPRLTQENARTSYLNPATGERSVYYVVERLHHWGSRWVSQEEFEKEFYCGN